MDNIAKCDIKRTPFATTQVDIICPFHGQYVYVRKLIESLLKNTLLPKFKLILVDDGSENSSFVDYWDQYGRESVAAKKDVFASTAVPQKIIGIRLDKQVGFGAALQAGYNVSNSPYVCFINSDCIIKDANWLVKMGTTLLNMKKEGVRLVSARSNNPVSDIVELGGSQKDEIPDQIPTKHLPLFCALAHRELFKKIGGFIRPYPYGGYEDEELFYRMKKQGYKQAVSGTSWVYHEGEVTIKTFLSDDKIRKIILDDNFNRLRNDVK